jgi:hypothetical protein
VASSTDSGSLGDNVAVPVNHLNLSTTQGEIPDTASAQRHSDQMLLAITQGEAPNTASAEPHPDDMSGLQPVDSELQMNFDCNKPQHIRVDDSETHWQGHGDTTASRVSPDSEAGLLLQQGHFNFQQQLAADNNGGRFPRGPMEAPLLWWNGQQFCLPSNTSHTEQDHHAIQYFRSSTYAQMQNDSYQVQSHYEDEVTTDQWDGPSAGSE